MGIRNVPGAATAVLLIAVTLGGCSETTVPQVLPAGSYVAATVNGGPLPAVIGTATADTLSLQSVTLTISQGNKALFTQQYARTVSGPLTVGFQWKVRDDGDKLYFDEAVPCPSNALCIAPPTAVRAADNSYLDITFRDIAPAPYTVRLLRSRTN